MWGALEQALGLAQQALTQRGTGVVCQDEDPAALLRVAVVSRIDHPPLHGVSEFLQTCKDDGEVAALAGRGAGQQPVDVLEHQVQQRPAGADAGLQQAVDAPPEHAFLASEA